MYSNTHYLQAGQGQGATMQEIEAWEQEQYMNQIELLREMIYEKNIPENIRKRLWGLTTKFLVLSNIKPEDERIFLREFEIVIDSTINCMPLDEYTSELENEFNNLRVWFRLAILRAKGPTRERALQIMQITENVNRTQAYGHQKSQSGFLSRLGSMLGRKQKNVQQMNDVAVSTLSGET